MKKIALLFNYIKNHKFSLVSLLFSLVFFVISSALIPFFTGKCIDEIQRVLSLEISSINDTSFFTYLFVIISLVAISTVSYLCSELMSAYITERVTKNIKDDLFKKINNLPIKYIDSHSHGDIVARIISDVDNVNSGLQGGFKQLMQGVFQIIVTLVIMFILNWILALVVVVLTPLSFFISYAVVRTSGKYFKTQAKINGEIGGYVLESLNNMEFIRSNCLGTQNFEKFATLDEFLYKEGQKAQFTSSFTNPSTRLINNTTVAIVTLVSSLLCALSWNDNNIILGASCSIGTIITFIQFANQFAKPLNEISSCLGEIQNGLASMVRIREILDMKDDVNEGKLENIDEIKEITFENVSFGYDENKYVLKNIDFSLKQNQKIAIVGSSGCGKTTLINLVLRFYDPQEGMIKINGLDAKTITKEELRNHFTMVLQDTWIFSGTIYENIAFGNKEANLDKVIEAAKLANCYDFIMKLPEGFNTKVSASSGLSQGEKQLICIARTFLNLKEVVILDEATSNVDARTELLVASAFDRIISNRTSIVIAHRLFTIKNSDFIIVMDEGKIVEVGTHDELLAKEGHYFNLYNAQYKED